MSEEERREIPGNYKMGETENSEEEEEKEDDKEDILPPDKSIRRRAVDWVNKKWEKRNLKKIERTYQREAEEGYKIVHIGKTCFTSAYDIILFSLLYTHKFHTSHHVASLFQYKTTVQRIC